MRIRFIEGTTERVYHLKDAAEADLTSPLVEQVITRTWTALTSSDLGWSNGDTMTVKVEYILPPTGTRVADQSLADGTTAGGIWANSETVWISDRIADRVFFVDRSTWSRDSAKDLTGLKAAGNDNATGIWSDGTTMWDSDADNKVYAYKMSDKSRDMAKGFILDTAHDSPGGIWSDEAIRSDGVDSWVTNYLPSKIFMHSLRCTSDIWSTTMTVGKYTSGTQTDYGYDTLCHT